MSAAVLLKVHLHLLTIQHLSFKVARLPTSRHFTEQINQQFPIAAIVEAQQTRLSLVGKLNQPRLQCGPQTFAREDAVRILAELRQNSRPHKLAAAISIKIRPFTIKFASVVSHDRNADEITV